MKFLQTTCSLINVNQIAHFSCLPRYATENGKNRFMHWSVEATTSCGSGIELKQFNSENDAKEYLADLVVKLGIEIVK